jgi:hypothetical protein
MLRPAPVVVIVSERVNVRKSVSEMSVLESVPVRNGVTDVVGVSESESVKSMDIVSENESVEVDVGVGISDAVGVSTSDADGLLISVLLSERASESVADRLPALEVFDAVLAEVGDSVIDLW